MASALVRPQRPPRTRQPPLQGAIGLRDVGGCPFAGRQPIVGGAELLAQEHDVLGAQIENHLRQHDVHESLDRGEQRLLLDVAQLRPGSPHGVLRLLDGVGGSEAEEERLVDRQRNPARIDRAVALGAARSPPRSVSLNGRIGVAPDGWPVAGQRLRDILVNAAQLGAGSVQVGVVLVGRAQCIVQRIGHGRAGAAHKHRYA